MEVLNDFGERRINRARQLLTEKGLAPIRLKPAGAKLFVTLKLSSVPLAEVSKTLDKESDQETYRLLVMLSRPYSFFYDFSSSWSIGELEEVCKEEGLNLPSPDDV